MALRVSTTGSDIFIRDLGITVVHPTTSRDLTLEFTAIELKVSAGLTTAIQNGSLQADDGSYVIYAQDYDPDEALIQQLGYKDDALYISEAELASKGDIYLKPDTFPLVLNSTAQVTKNVYCPSARWITWQLSPGDKIVLSECQAHGVYTVDTVLDQQNLLVSESIVDSTGGFIAAYHPVASTRIGVNTHGLQFVQGDTLQAAIESIDDHIGENAGMDFNRMIVDTEGDIVYSTDGDFCITTVPLPRPVLG